MTFPLEMMAYLPRGDNLAFLDWLGSHFDWHQKTHDAATRPVASGGLLGLPPYPLSSLRDATDLEQWANLHSQQHITEAHVLKMYEPADLSLIDQTDEENWNVWHKAHAEIHIDQRTFLKL